MIAPVVIACQSVVNLLLNDSGIDSEISETDNEDEFAFGVVGTATTAIIAANFKENMSGSMGF